VNFAAAVDGMGWVLGLWLVGVAVLSRALLAGAASFRLPSLASLHRDESGLSYSLSYVLVAPVYLAFLCMVFTASLLLLAKIGTMYAAHAGARSAVVWQSAQPTDLREERTQQAVFTAMAPFVSASARDLATARTAPPAAAGQQAAEFIAAYTFYSTGSKNLQPPLRRPYTRQTPDAGYLLRKYMNAATRTTFRVGGEPNRAGGPTTVTVTYRSPIYIPGVNRFLDRDGFWPYEMEITSAATLPSETPDTANRTLGFNYRSR
jgi:Flp pilus assembly protein TadG